MEILFTKVERRFGIIKTELNDSKKQSKRAALDNKRVDLLKSKKIIIFIKYFSVFNY